MNMNICLKNMQVRPFKLGLSALLVPQVLPKSNFGPSTFFSLKLAPKHLIRSTYHPWQRF
jgi:hypothetical protein